MDRMQFDAVSESTCHFVFDEIQMLCKILALLIRTFNGASMLIDMRYIRKKI